MKLFNKVFVILLLLAFPFILNGQNDLNIHPDLIPHLDKKLAPFYHGVASGDPTQNSVMIWTKLTLPKNTDQALVHWEMDTDSLFKKPTLYGGTSVSATNDYSVKIDVQGLKENTKYYYRFEYEKKYSIIGQTYTLPSNPDEFSIAFASCSNYEWGFFNNYRLIAEDSEVKLVVHLGDYIYEYAPNGYGDTTLGRINVPAKEITTLDDYRTRYSLYRLDKDLMKMHQMKPTITTWDDHEIANNGYVEGAQNHQPNTEGEWLKRKSYGKQAYYEWMPVRDNEYHELYRSFQLGSLMELIILDTRIAGRTKQVNVESDPEFMDSSRTILGKDQYNWLMNKIENKNTTWKIIGNQVPFGPLYQPDMQGKAEKYMDGWDGYPYERSKLIKTLLDEKIKNIIWVTGDYHCSFAFENDLMATVATEDNASIEFVVTSITSANDDEWLPRDTAINGQKEYLKFNPHCKYVNNVDNGYLVIKIEKEKITSSFYYSDTVKKPSTNKRKEKVFIVRKNQAILEEVK